MEGVKEEGRGGSLACDLSPFHRLRRPDLRRNGRMVKKKSGAHRGHSSSSRLSTMDSSAAMLSNHSFFSCSHSAPRLATQPSLALCTRYANSMGFTWGRND
ncbi:unnamed protein product [Arctogadus glacialis]